MEEKLFTGELRSCVKVKGTVLGSPAIPNVALMVSVDVKQH